MYVLDPTMNPNGIQLVHCNEGALARHLADPSGLATARSGARCRAEDGFDIRKLANALWDDYRTFVPATTPQRRSA